MTIIQQVYWHPLRISAKTVWCLVEIKDGDGRRGFGEATLTGQEEAVQAALARYHDLVLGQSAQVVDLSKYTVGISTLPEFAALSALDQAVWDLRGKQQSVSTASLLGDSQRTCIPLYANVNRGIVDRTPAGFAAQAARAVASGFSAIKIAPFDEITLYGDNQQRLDADALDMGLARMRAVRDAIGTATELMVDCHWRLNDKASLQVLDEAQGLNLYWLECPLPESEETIPRIQRLRSYANARGIRLAGCELKSLDVGFAPYLDAGAYDVMMPDIKYAGGMREMLSLAARFHAHGVAFSPHNPSGPIAHAASLQVCVVADNFHKLELQFDETPLFDAIVEQSLPGIHAGQIDASARPGFGLSISDSLLSTLRQ